MMISRTPRAFSLRGQGSIRSLSTFRPASLALPRPAQASYQCRAKSTIVERSPLHSVPSKAEGVGKPAVDTKKGKVWASAHDAVQDVKPGSFILSSGKSASRDYSEEFLKLTRNRVRIMWNCGNHHTSSKRHTVNQQPDGSLQQCRRRRCRSRYVPPSTAEDLGHNILINSTTHPIKANLQNDHVLRRHQ
jgi:hypothetical protein